jgi:hypothetical protein
MATFPSLEPATRALTLGDVPQLTHVATSSIDVRFVQGSDRVLQNLSLGYENLSETEAQQIIDHFNGQEGSLISFDLPNIIWSGYSAPPVSASDYKFIYAAGLDISNVSPLRYNVAVELTTIPV